MSAPGAPALEKPPPVPRNVLVIKPSSLGDVVHTLPAVHALKAARPDAEITWLVNTEWAPLLAENADLARVVEFPRRQFRGLAGLMTLPRWLAGLSRLQPDLALDFQGLARSASLAKAARARRIHGLSDAREGAGFFYHRRVPIDPAEHSVERYLRLVTDLGIAAERPLKFPLPAGTRPPGFTSTEPYLLLHPFSRGEGKSMPHEAVFALCEAVTPMQVVLVGGSAAPFSAPRNCADFLNRTSLAELIFLIRHAHFTVSVDSGPMHIAAALTDRLLGIHTWSDPRSVGPFNGATAWVWKGGEIAHVPELSAAALGSSVPFKAGHVPQLAAFLCAEMNPGGAEARRRGG